MTRRFLLSISAAAMGVVLAGGVSLAQRGNRQPPSVDEQVKRMAEHLHLSADQQAKIKPLFESRRTQMEALRSDTSLSREDRMARMRTIQESTVSKVKEVLNDDQKKQYDEMRQEMRDRMQQRRGRGQGSNP